MSLRQHSTFLSLLAIGTVSVLLLSKASARRMHPVPMRGSMRPTGAFGRPDSSDEPRQVQAQRAREPGHGRGAGAPWNIGWAGWKDILWRTYQQVGEDRLLAISAGVVFYALLAFVPAVSAFVSLYGLFATPSSINEHLSAATGLMPSSAIELLREQVTRLAANGGTKLGLAFIVSLAFALWSANAGVKAIMDALNVVYEEDEKRGFIELNAVSLALTMGMIVTLLLSVGAVVVMPLVLNYVGIGEMSHTILAAAKWPVLLIFIIVGLAILYRFGPSRTEARWQWLSVGSVVAALTWIAGSALFSWYLENLANYNSTYGSLGAVVGMMMWMWISSIVILFGAELNSEIEHQTARDSTVDGEKPLGARGAVMADTVGPSWGGLRR